MPLLVHVCVGATLAALLIGLAALAERRSCNPQKRFRDHDNHGAE